MKKIKVKFNLDLSATIKDPSKFYYVQHENTIKFGTVYSIMFVTSRMMERTGIKKKWKGQRL